MTAAADDKPIRRIRVRRRDAPRWYCVQAKHTQDFFAKQRLEAQGFQVFMPLELIVYKKKPPEFKPMFLGYFFVRFNVVRDKWPPILYTPGVSKLLSYDLARPTSVPDKVIESLMDQVKQPEDAWVKMPHIDPGTVVTITNGAFVETKAICLLQQKERVTLLMSILDNDVEVEFSRVNVRIG